MNKSELRIVATARLTCTMVVVVGFGIAACSPAEIATDITRRTARTVVAPIVSATTPAPADALATDCIMANASNAQLNNLARDVGVRAGTLTYQNVRVILSKPATQACISSKGLAPVVV